MRAHHSGHALTTQASRGDESPWKWLALLCAAEVGTMLTFSGYAAVLPVLQREWGMSAGQAGAVFAAQQLGYTLAVLVLSTLTDVWGVRRIYLLSSLWNGLANLAFPWLARDFASAFALRLICGAGLAGTYMPGMRLVVERFDPQRRGAAVGLYVACFSVGAAVSLAAAGALLPWGWRWSFLLPGLGPLAAFALAWRVAQDPPHKPRAPVRVREVLRNRAAMRYVLAYAAHNWELFGMRAWLSSFLAALWVAQGVPLSSAAARGAAFGSVVLLAGAASNALGGWVSDRAGRRQTAVAVLLASAVASCTVGWTLPLGPGVVLPLVLAYGLLVTAESSTLSAAVAESANPRWLGTTMALQSGLGFVVTAISPALFGWLLDRAGWGVAFASLGVVALCGALALARPQSPGARSHVPDGRT
ncbi:MAG: MFS transporter [Armatimonadota bacterium]|nr:MFS transporter [Armatimonadota bacterium]MDW8156829.1 MFS transporter [Armatimonadota bacterium]